MPDGSQGKRRAGVARAIAAQATLCAVRFARRHEVLARRRQGQNRVR